MKFRCKIGFHNWDYKTKIDIGIHSFQKGGVREIKHFYGYFIRCKDCRKQKFINMGAVE